MNTRDYITPPVGGISDCVIEEGGRRSIDPPHAWATNLRRLDDLTSGPGAVGHANYRSLDFDPRSEPGSFWPFYHPYEPEMPTPVGYERLAPPPPASAPDPEPRLPKYNDGLMTAALFDWEMRHGASARIEPVGSSSDVIPARLADIVIDTLMPELAPDDGPW